MLYSDIRSPGLRINLNEGRKPSLLQSISRRDLETCSTDGKLAKNYDRALFNALKPAKKRKVCMYPYL